MDNLVLSTQQWLNETYGAIVGWEQLDEDGQTGWETIYGLRRGLQHELGISPVASGFGPLTTAEFVSQIGEINGTTTSERLLRLLAGSLWCKGYWAVQLIGPIHFSDMALTISKIRSDLGLSSGPVSIDVKLMASLMSMDSYSELPGGSSAIREVQQWLNGTYSHRGTAPLVPCDGIFSRQIQTAMLYALQYEFGMDDDTANGNFGPGTRTGLQTQATVRQGDSDSNHHFVRLFQAALRLNGYTTTFDGGFNAGLVSQVLAFQSDLELPATGQGDYGTWCALLVSTGDPTRSVSGFDTATQLSPAQAQGAKSAGYTHIGRYTVGAGKFLTSQELAGLKAAGIALFPIHQRYNNSDAVMTRGQGKTQGTEALERCRTLGIPPGSTIFFAVDYDPSQDSISGPVSDFFRGVHDALSAQLLGTYEVGVYGTRNVCRHLCEAGLASAAFVAGMSVGWSGNMGFPMPKPWAYNQILETTEIFAGVPINVDRDAISNNAPAVHLGAVTPPPTEKDGSTTDTGFDILFEWIVKAEASCERALKTASGNMSIYAPFLPPYILGWLRKPRYWDDRYADFLWRAFTPEIYVSDAEAKARVICEAALDNMDDVRQMPGLNTQYRDIAHMAATTLGYQTWGPTVAPNQYAIGDLGGWLLDLLQSWGQYTNDFSSQNLGSWMGSAIGKSGGVGHGQAGYFANPQSDFGYADVLADADAWLLAKALSGDPNELALSRALRSIYQEDGNARIRRFYSERFSGNSANVVYSFSELALGVITGNLPVPLPFPTEVLKAAANTPVMPTPGQAQTCALAYAAFLANPHR